MKKKKRHFCYPCRVIVISAAAKCGQPFTYVVLLVWRANVENVTNEKYWASVDDTGTYVTQGDPRSLKLSVSVDF